MKNTKEANHNILPNENTTYHNLLLAYYNKITNQLPNQINSIISNKMNFEELFSLLQLNIDRLIEVLLSNQQFEYETLLQHHEKQIRLQFRVLNQMKLKKSAMENIIQSFLNKEKEYEELKKTNGLLLQKENEIIILRSENSKLKSAVFRLESQLNNSNEINEALEKQILDFNVGPDRTGSNINININDLSNSKVIIKTANNSNPLQRNNPYSHSNCHSNSNSNSNRNSNKASAQYGSPLKKKQIKQINLSGSNSNRNVLLATYRSALSPNKTTTVGSNCQTKNNVNNNTTTNRNCNSNGNANNNSNNNSNTRIYSPNAKSNMINSIADRGSFINNTSRLWNIIQGDLGKLNKKMTNGNLIVTTLNHQLSNNNIKSTNTSINNNVKVSRKLTYLRAETFRDIDPTVKKR